MNIDDYSSRNKRWRYQNRELKKEFKLLYSDALIMPNTDLRLVPSCKRNPVRIFVVMFNLCTVLSLGLSPAAHRLHHAFSRNSLMRRLALLVHNSQAGRFTHTSSSNISIRYSLR